MRSLSENIQNRVDKLPKPSSAAQALQPLFEAISNARFAIYDRFDDRATKIGRIAIDIQNIRNADQIIIEVSDNGIGLDDTRFEAFCEVDTDYKKAKGGKGVGRLFWLDAFNRIEVRSRFGADLNEVRNFEFRLSKSNQIDEILDAAGRSEIGTTIRFSGVKNGEYEKRFPRKEDTFLRYFTSHFISDFLLGISPEIALNIDGSITRFPDEVRDLVVQEFESVSWESDEFGKIEISGFICNLSASSGLEGLHQLHLLGDGRTVESRKIDGLLGIGALDGNGEKDACLHVCVDAPFLDSRVNEGRTAFNIPESKIKELVREIVAKVRETFVVSQISEYQIQRSENYRQFIRSYPIYDFDDPEAQLNRIPFGANSPEEFAAGLVKHQIRREEDRQKSLQEVIQSIVEDGEAAPDFGKAIADIAAELQQSERLSLAQHVARRKLVLELLDILLKRLRKLGDKADHFLENTVHSILCPTGISATDSHQLEARLHDLWVVDERLAFSRAFSSDKRLNSVLAENDSILRPDLLVWDLAYGLAYTDDAAQPGTDINRTVNDMMIVELKKPMRKHYRKYEDNVEQQILKYIKDLKSGTIESFDSNRLRISDQCQFHCFVVADIVGDLEDQLSGWAKTPDGEGRFRPIQGDHRGNITVVQWNNLINDAWMRNHASISAAGLSRTDDQISELQNRLRRQIRSAA